MRSKNEDWCWIFDPLYKAKARVSFIIDYRSIESVKFQDSIVLSAVLESIVIDFLYKTYCHYGSIFSNRKLTS